MLKSSADATPELYSKLETSVSEQEKYKQENRELVFKIEELEEQIDSLKETVNNYQTLNKSDKEEVCFKASFSFAFNFSIFLL